MTKETFTEQVHAFCYAKLDGQCHYKDCDGCPSVAGIWLAISRGAEAEAKLAAVEYRSRTKPRIVCLCGSTRFMDAFFEEGWRLTLEGEIVLSVGVCKHVDASGGHGAEMIGQDVADRLDELHFRKIDLADYVRVLNVDGYIGSSTRKEIAYAERLGKPVEYLTPYPDDQLEEVSHGA